MKEMSEEICECGHSRAEHFNFIDRLDKKTNRPYREYVAKGLGKCSQCDCKQFKKKERS